MIDVLTYEIKRIFQQRFMVMIAIVVVLLVPLVMYRNMTQETCQYVSDQVICGARDGEMLSGLEGYRHEQSLIDEYLVYASANGRHTLEQQFDKLADEMMQSKEEIPKHFSRYKAVSIVRARLEFILSEVWKDPDADLSLFYNTVSGTLYSSQMTFDETLINDDQQAYIKEQMKDFSPVFNNGDIWFQMIQILQIGGIILCVAMTFLGGITYTKDKDLKCVEVVGTTQIGKVKLYGIRMGILLGIAIISTVILGFYTLLCARLMYGELIGGNTSALIYFYMTPYTLNEVFFYGIGLILVATCVSVIIGSCIGIFSKNTYVAAAILLTILFVPMFVNIGTSEIVLNTFFPVNAVKLTGTFISAPYYFAYDFASIRWKLDIIVWFVIMIVCVGLILYKIYQYKRKKGAYGIKIKSC